MAGTVDEEMLRTYQGLSDLFRDTEVLGENLASARAMYHSRLGHKQCPRHAHENFDNCGCPITCSSCFENVPAEYLALDRKLQQKP